MPKKMRIISSLLTHQKHMGRNIQRLGEAVDYVDGGIAQGFFDTAYIGAVYVGLEAKLLL
jgi:hypothetical protein